VTDTTASNSPVPFGRALLIGLVAGLLSGSFGVGGGVLMVPAMVLVLGMDQRRASGTSLAAIVPIAVFGVAGFAVQDQVDYPAALLLGVGAIVGAPIGARLIHAIPVARLRVAFAVLLLVTAARLLFELPDPVLSDSISVTEGVLVVLVGLASGVLAGLFGVGGGILMVPAQILILGIDPAVAKGTSLLVIIPASISGTIQNLRLRNADVRLATILGLSGVATSFAGAFIATRMSATVAGLLFAALLTFSAVRMLQPVARWRTHRPGVAAAAGGGGDAADDDQAEPST
jgi:uncharacterized protein